MRRVALSTGRAPGDLDQSLTDWQPELGIGVLTAPPEARPAQAVATVRALSRTAWSYSSRMAWYDRTLSQITELPLADPA
jgi:hypothetical protein